MRPVDGRHVNQHVEPSQCRRGFVNEPRAFAAARQVRLQHDRATPERAHGLCSLLSFGLGTLIGQRHVEPAAGQDQGNDGADAFGAGYQDC